MPEQFRQLMLILVTNKGKLIGSALGLLLGWLTLRYGFLKALFVILCLTGGYYAGSRIDRHEGLSEITDRLFRTNRR